MVESIVIEGEGFGVMSGARLEFGVISGVGSGFVTVT